MRAYIYLIILSLMGCATAGKGHWCDNVYLDPECVKRRLAEQKRLEKEFVLVCDNVIGSRIPREKNCKLVSREAVRRAMETRGNQ